MKRLAIFVLVVMCITMGVSNLTLAQEKEIDWQERALRAENLAAQYKAMLLQCQAKVEVAEAEKAKQAVLDYLEKKKAAATEQGTEKKQPTEPETVQE